MQEFIDFLKYRMSGNSFEIQDCDEYHSSLVIGTNYNKDEGSIVSEFIIPLMSRFILISNENELNPTTGVHVRTMDEKQHYFIVAKQIEDENKIAIRISITSMRPCCE